MSAGQTQDVNWSHNATIQPHDLQPHGLHHVQGGKTESENGSFSQLRFCLRSLRVVETCAWLLMLSAGVVVAADGWIQMARSLNCYHAHTVYALHHIVRLKISQLCSLKLQVPILAFLKEQLIGNSQPGVFKHLVLKAN